MPIYEFFCDRCNMLFNFMSHRIDTTSRPPCPRCGKAELERRPARFATLRRSGSGDEAEDDDNPFPGLDEERLEQAMEAMGSELEQLGDDEDPRQMARFFRRFGEVSGMKLGPRMEEMLRRLEAGEDPDALEEEMGGAEDGNEGDLEEWFQLKETATRLRRRRPKLDEQIYFL